MAGAAGGMRSDPELLAKFKKLAASSIDDQQDFFLKSFVFALGDEWKSLVALKKTFVKSLKDVSAEGEELNEIQASQLLQQSGVARTAQQRTAELKDVDLDNNKMISFLEYCLLHYKAMVLEEYYKRHGQDCPHDLTHKGVGIIGVGPQLLEELFHIPEGLSEELIAALAALSKAQRERSAKQKKLEETAEKGGVKGLAAKNELEQMEKEDLTEMRKVEITLKAAKKKQSKDSAGQALDKKKKEEEARKKAEAQASKERLAKQRAMFEGK